MFYKSIQVLAILLVGVFGCAVVSAQSGTNPSPLDPRTEKEDPPSGIREMLVKMQIEKDKKDHEEMLARGKQALELSNDLEASIKIHQQVTEEDRAKLETLEKLAKKIRGELGGGDDDEAISDDDAKAEKPKTFMEGFKSLQTATVKLVDELQKTTRFSISAAAIQSSNSVLRITRYLRFWK